MLALLLALQQTLTVDDDGPADFTEIQAAVDAAAPGSLILVRPGTYDRVTLPAHSISIVADGEPGLLDPPRPYIDQGDPLPCFESNLDYFAPVYAPERDPGSEIVLRGIDLRAYSQAVQPGLFCKAGDSFSQFQAIRIFESGPIPGATLWIEDVESVPRGAAVLAEGSIVITRSRFHGHDGSFDADPFSSRFAQLPARPGLHVVSTTLESETELLVFDSEFTGGDAVLSQTSAAEGASIGSGTRVAFTRCTLQGGGNAPLTVEGAASGLFAQLSTLFMASTTVTPGDPSVPDIATFPPNDFTFSNAPDLSVDVDAVVRGGETIEVVVRGKPGLVTFLLYGFESEPLLVPDFNTGSALGLTPPGLLLGPIPANGEIVLPVDIPELPPGLPFLRWVLQPAGVGGSLGGSLGVTLGAPTMTFAVPASI